MRIEHAVALGNIWGDSDMTGVDQAASERAYIEQLHAALEAAYPDAEIVLHAERVSGVSSEPRVTGSEDEEAAWGDYDELVASVTEVIGQVWQTWLESGVVYDEQAVS